MPVVGPQSELSAPAICRDRRRLVRSSCRDHQSACRQAARLGIPARRRPVSRDRRRICQDRCRDHGLDRRRRHPSALGVADRGRNLPRLSRCRMGDDRNADQHCVGRTAVPELAHTGVFQAGLPRPRKFAGTRCAAARVDHPAGEHVLAQKPVGESRRALCE